MSASDDVAPAGESDQLIISSAETETAPTASTTSPLVFIFRKCITLFLFVAFAAADVWPCPGGAISLILAMAEFWGTKNVDGLALVGLRWSHEICENGEPRWVFYSRRDPYVPEPANAAIFWAATFGAVLTWFAITLTTLFIWRFFYAVVALVICALHAVNVSCFVKCHAVSNRQADDVARSVLLGSPDGETQLVVDE